MIAEALVKGLFVLQDGAPVPFLYNPSEIDDGRTVEYEELNPLGFSHSVLHYKHAKSDPVTFTMSVGSRLPYTSIQAPMSVEVFIGLLEDITCPVFKAGRMVSAPPEVVFVFGMYIKTGLIKNIKVSRKQFSPLLTIERADIAVTMQETVRVNRNRLNAFGY